MWAVCGRCAFAALFFSSSLIPLQLTWANKCHSRVCCVSAFFLIFSSRWRSVRACFLHFCCKHATWTYASCIFRAPVCAPWGCASCIFCAPVCAPWGLASCNFRAPVCAPWAFAFHKPCSPQTCPSKDFISCCHRARWSGNHLTSTQADGDPVDWLVDMAKPSNLPPRKFHTSRGHVRFWFHRQKHPLWQQHKCWN